MSVLGARTVLVVEDDPAIRRGLVDSLRFVGYQTAEAADGRAGQSLALSLTCDLVLLDLALPGVDGLAILTAIRESRPTLPVIILTARGEERDRVQGLKLGADDYVVKPFSVKELLARVEAVIRRSPERPLDVPGFAFPGGAVDFDHQEVRFEDGTSRVLSEREIELLRYLACHPGRAISRDEIMSRVWRIDPHGLTTRTIDMHIARLRDKLRDGSHGHEPTIVRTIRGKGYMFAPQAAPQSDPQPAPQRDMHANRGDV